MSSESLTEITQELKEKVVLGCRILARAGLFDYLGLASTRLPGTDRVVINQRGADLGNFHLITLDRVVTVDMEGNRVEGKYRPPGEVRMHTEIYKARSDVGAIVHSHQPVALAFGAVRRRLVPMGAGRLLLATGDIPIFDSSKLIVNVELARAVVRTLGQHTVCHLRHHGVVVVGKNLEAAVSNAILLEEMAKLNLMACLIGEPQGIPPEEMQLMPDREEKEVPATWRYHASLLSSEGAGPGRGL